eukprot:4476971-Pyramimonas_sp.AAC.1
MLSKGSSSTCSPLALSSSFSKLWAKGGQRRVRAVGGLRQQLCRPAPEGSPSLQLRRGELAPLLDQHVHLRVALEGRGGPPAALSAIRLQGPSCSDVGRGARMPQRVWRPEVWQPSPAESLAPSPP